LEYDAKKRAKREKSGVKRRPKRAQSDARIGFALQGGGRPKVKRRSTEGQQTKKSGKNLSSFLDSLDIIGRFAQNL